MLTGSLIINSTFAGAATSSLHIVVSSSRLYVGASLPIGGVLASPSGRYKAAVLKNGAMQVSSRGRAIWTSNAGSGLRIVLTREPDGALTIVAPRRTSHVSRRSVSRAPSYLSVQNNGDLALYTKTGVILWQSGPRAQLASATSLYTPGELYASSNPSVICYTCQASVITGAAPPSNTLDSGTQVDAMTGDFSTQLPLFSAPAIGATLSLSLGYDAQLAQSQLTAGTGTGPFGVGWSSNFSASINQQTGSSASQTLTVNQGNGSEVTFSQSANAGTSASCLNNGAASGDNPSTSKYTISGSNHQWCALASVQGQVSDQSSVGVTYQRDGGKSIEDFAWNGQLSQVTTNTASPSPPVGGDYVLYNVAGGSIATTPAGVPLSEQCPSGVTCTIVYSSDGRSVVEEMNSLGLVTTIVDPSGATYALSYDANRNLVSVTKPSTTATPSIWKYVYATSNSSPYSSELTEIYDPLASTSTPATLSSGVAHSTTINYNATSATNPGMVASLVDGTGASTTYSYSQPCATGQCVGVGQSQTTTITYPAELPCPSTVAGCVAQSPVEVDQYSGGLETSTELGSPSNPLENETWSYAWNYGNGVANTSEVITYPSTLAATTAGVNPATATIVSDPAGNVTSTTNALGDVATSAYNDVGGNNLNELLWSYPGPSSNAPSSPPQGASSYTYNDYGQVLTATNPLGDVTTYGYYGAYSLLCYVAPPSVSIALGGSAPGCSGTGANVDSGALGAPIGSTTYSYDAQGDVVASTLDAGDSGANADPQTTTAAYDVMGNQLWSIPATGQTLVQSATNPFATSTTYAANVPVTVHGPDAMTTNYTYDVALNVVGTTTPAATTTTVFDGDNRVCYSVTAATTVTGLTCSSPAQAGSNSTTYVPGSTTTATSTDANNNTTAYYYADLAYPTSPTEVVDPMGTQINYTAYNDYGDGCVSGSVQPTLGATQCTTLAGDLSSVVNALGATIQVTDPNGNVTYNYYENSAYPTALTRTTNALGATTRYVYDAAGERITTINPDASAVSTGYNVNGQVCHQEPTASSYPCGEGPSAAGVSLYTYNNAQELTSMSDNTGNPATPFQWSQVTTYSYLAGQLTSSTDANKKTISYSYNNAGQVACVAYPVSANASCGTSSAPATPSSTNTIMTKSYDTAGRLTSTSDWLGNTVGYSYADANAPGAVTKITYPASTGLSASYTYDNNGNVTGLSAGTSISDAWTYNADEQQASSTVNGVASGTVAYNANGQITAATNLATSSSNDIYSVAANGEITGVQSPSGTTVASSYNAGAELCNSSPTATACGTTPTSGTGYQYTTNGQRSSATVYAGGSATSTTKYAWNSYGALCNVAPTVTPCGTTPTSGVSYQYNGEGLRVSTASANSSTTSTWDQVSGGSIPLNINDTTTPTTSTGATSNASYLYGVLLFGGTAPVEQINTTSSGSVATFLVASPSGVQGVYGSTGTLLELALYSPYGSQSITSGSSVTPFGFQGSYTDSTGLIYLINRYYDPSTDQFISIDPVVAQTNQPYAFTNDNPLNATDPLGQCGGWFGFVCSAYDATRHATAASVDWSTQHPMQILGGVAIVLGVASGVGIFVAADALIGAATVEALSAAEVADAAVGTGAYSSALDASMRASAEAATTTAEVVAHAAPILLGVSAPLVGAGFLLLKTKSPIKDRRRKVMRRGRW